MNSRLLVFSLPIASFALGTEATTPGEVTAPYPTITNLAVEWKIDGDDDLDASCKVRFRQDGDTGWLFGMPLRRVPAGSSKNADPIITWTNRLSGSLFDLQPGTNYEIELTLHDPDGGEATHLLQARTRPVPAAAKEAPIIIGSCPHLHAANPGEVILLENGDYGAVRFNREGEPGKPGKGARQIAFPVDSGIVRADWQCPCSSSSG